jgi:hypothetical protein
MTAAKAIRKSLTERVCGSSFISDTSGCNQDHAHRLRRHNPGLFWTKKIHDTPMTEGERDKAKAQDRAAPMTSMTLAMGRIPSPRSLHTVNLQAASRHRLIAVDSEGSPEGSECRE